MEAQTGRTCELIDGTLVEKTMGYFEAWLASEILFLIRSYLEQHDLGIVPGPDGCLRLFPQRVPASPTWHSFAANGCRMAGCRGNRFHHWPPH